MKTRNYLILVVILLINAALLFLNLNKQPILQSLGSVSDGTAYNATTTRSTSASATSFYLAKTGSGVLGSIVIASTSPSFTNTATMFGVYNGVTSTTTASSTLARFPNTSANGTYTYDVAFDKGLMIDVPPGFDGVYTVTWK